jgi:hypothetical protein
MIGFRCGYSRYMRYLWAKFGGFERADPESELTHSNRNDPTLEAPYGALGTGDGALAPELPSTFVAHATSLVRVA